MDRSCENCRFCIYARSMRGKEELYCERHSKWIRYTILCSEWEMVSVPKPKTNADRIRSMTDEELAEFMIGVLCYTKLPYIEVRKKVLRDNELLDWLKEEAISDG